MASVRAVMCVDGFIYSCNKCIGSELDLTDVIEDNLVDLGEMRKNTWWAIGGVGVESVKSPSDHYFSRVLVDKKFWLMQRPVKDIEQWALELGSVPTSFSAIVISGTILFSLF